MENYKFGEKIFFKDTASRYIWCNDNMAKDLKIKQTDIKGKTDFDFFNQSLAEKYIADDKAVMSGGKTKDIVEEYEINGVVTKVKTVKSPIYDEKGILSGLVGVFWNAEEEEKLLSNYKLLADNTNDVIYLLNLDETYEYVSPSIKNLLGYTPEEALKLKVGDILALESYQKQKEKLQYDYTHGNRSGTRQILKAYKKDKSTIWIEINAKFIFDQNGMPQKILGVARDVTHRVEVEEKLKSQIKKLEEINKLTVNRELKMIELKKEIEQLKAKIN
jgi:PAS domain S-box-containing protein